MPIVWYGDLSMRIVWYGDLTVGLSNYYEQEL